VSESEHSCSVFSHTHSHTHSEKAGTLPLFFLTLTPTHLQDSPQCHGDTNLSRCQQAKRAGSIVSKCQNKANPAFWFGMKKPNIIIEFCADKDFSKGNQKKEHNNTTFCWVLAGKRK
jgi:hypothetical protein